MVRFLSSSLLLLAAGILLMKDVNAGFTGNVCTVKFRYYSRQVYYVSCGACGWKRCPRYRSIARYCNYQKCCTGWEANLDRQCIIPICSPRCRNGGRCIRPNTCRCPSTHFGGYCENPRPCSNQHPCYPGTCPNNVQCRCTDGFDGSYCDNMRVGLQSPKFSMCTATLSDRIGDIDELVVNTSCHLKNSDPSATTYVREQDWNHVKIQWTSSYVPSLPDRPNYIRDVKIGIVAGIAEMRLGRKDGMQILTRNITCSNGDSTTTPSASSTCSVEHSFTEKFRHQDKLHITFYTKNGGFKEIINGSPRQRNFNGVWATEMAEFVFDFMKPFHRGHPDSALVINVMDPDNAGSFTMELQWNNWFDDSGKVEKYAYSIYKGKTTSNDTLTLDGVWRAGERWPLVTLIDRATYYTVILQVSDRAGNVAERRGEIYVETDIPTMPPNLCYERTKPCYPSGICPPYQDQCMCTEGFSGDGCNKMDVGASINDFRLILNDSEGEKIRLNHTNKMMYTNKVDYTELTVEWVIAYDPFGDLPEKPEFVNEAKIGIVHHKGVIALKERDRPSYDDEHTFSPADLCLNNSNVDSPFIGETQCSYVYNNPKAKQHGDSLAVVLDAKCDGTITLANAGSKDYDHIETKKTIEVQFDTEPPYHDCELEDIELCEEDKLSLSLQPQGSRYILVISWKFWKDDLSGIDRYEYSVYHSDGTGNITDFSVALHQSEWEDDPESSPTYNIEEEDLKNAYTILLKIVDRAENFVTITRDIDCQADPLVLQMRDATVEDDISRAGGVLLFVVVALIVVIIVMIIAFIFYRRRQIKAGKESDYQPHVFKRLKTRLEKESWYASRFGSGLGVMNKAYKADDTTKKRYSVFDYGDDELYVYDNKAYNGTDKVRTDTVTLKELLVNGRFANIRKAEWLAIKCEDTKIVIAKALKDSRNEEDRKLMLEKIKFQSKLPRHDNVVAFLGQVTTDEEQGPYMLLEYCELGTLRDWLTSNVHGREVSPDTHDHLVGFCLHVARGMGHLAKNKVVHGSLMAKNVLLNSKLIAKVTGFGPKDEEKEKARLPTKWLAIEVLNDMDLKRTTKSDVWAYGICVWEIFSLGQLPYNKPGHSGQKAEMISLLESGYRPEQPEECPDQIYNDVLMKCWRKSPSERPTFSQIESEINKVFHPPPSDDNMYYE